MTENTLLKSALWYLNKGFSVIPVQKNKKPFVSWEKFQKVLPTKEEVEDWWTEWPSANIGIITGKLSGLTVVDIDTMEGRERLLAILPFEDTPPQSLTPSGGSHRYYKYEEGISNAVRFIEGCDVRSEGGYIVAPPSFDDRGKYAWEKDFHIAHSELLSMPKALIEAIKTSHNSIYNINSFSLGSNVTTSINPETASNTSNEFGNTGNTLSNTSNNVKFDEGGRDNALFHLANHLVRGGMPPANIRKYLHFIATHCTPPFPEKEIESKIKSALHREEVRDTTVAQEVRNFVLVTTGNFVVTEVEQVVTLVTRANRKSILMALSRLCKEGLIERIGAKSGTYRRIESEFDVVDMNSVKGDGTVNIKLPFEFDSFVDIFPKDLIVIAGVPNAGKTALMLETVRRNMYRHKCWYFSSEMGRVNCKHRLSKHESETNWCFNFIDDFPNFVDVIQPNDINFIDYVEVLEGDYYRIPSLLAQIQKKLVGGIAIVALQKNSGQSHAIGGQQTLAKPAIFFAVDPKPPGATIRAIKAKNYKEENPNGYELHFKIIQGINLQKDGFWMPEV